MTRAASTRAALAMLACAGAWLCACGKDRVAGGYDDVENPAIQVALKNPDGSPALAARVGFYARYQNPFRDSTALRDFSPATGTVTVRDTALLAAFEAARARGTATPGKDTLEFNLYAAGAGGEAFLGGYALVRRVSGWGFVRKDGGSIAYPGSDGVLAAPVALPAPVAVQRGTVGPKGLELGLKRVFVPGSPYKAELGADGSFTFAHLAAGRYELKAVSADEKIYTAADSLAAGTAYGGSDWSEAEVIWVQGNP